MMNKQESRAARKELAQITGAVRRRTAPKHKPNKEAEEVLGICTPAIASHKYLKKKGIGPDGLWMYPKSAPLLMVGGKDVRGWLAIPVKEIGGHLQSLQFIAPDGTKTAMKSWKFYNGCHVVGDLATVSRSYICEGIGQAKTALMGDTRSVAVCCFGVDNMPKIARDVRNAHPDMEVIIVPDRGQEDKADELASLINGLCVHMPEESVSNYDINDYMKEHGIAKVRDLLRTAAAPQACITQPNDAGNAKLMVRQHGEKLRYCVEQNKWMGWIEDGRWYWDEGNIFITRCAKETVKAAHIDAANEPDDTKRKSAVQHALRMGSRRSLEAMIHLAKDEHGIPIRINELDADPLLLGVINGTIELRTGMLCNSMRDDLITKRAFVAHDCLAKCPTWLKFLRKIMNNNQAVIDFLQRAIGYSLTGHITEQCLFFLYGTGANGKTTLLNVIKALLGDYALQAAAKSLMVKQGDSIPNDIARLRGARFVATSEVESGKRLDEEQVKQLTGGDTVTARFLYGEHFEFTPQFKIWLAANHKPIIRGDDYAIWRRIRLIPFNVTIQPKEQDGKLTDKLFAELPGILNWAIEGCLAWQREGLNPPAEVLQATQAYRDEMDIVQEFLNERCTIGKAERCKAGDLYRVYSNWADAAGLHPMSQPVFSRKLKERGFESRRTTAGGRQVGFYYFGLSLLDTKAAKF